jgi:hypothetical protein
MSELSWQLCVYPWLSRYVKRRWDRFQHSTTCWQACVGSCGHVSLHRAINVAASRDPGAGRAYPLLKAPGRGDWMLGPIPGRGGRRNGQTGGEIMPAHVYHNEGKRKCRLLPSLVLFRLVALLFNQEWWSHIRYVVYGSPAICYWRKSVIYRILGCNRWSAVPGVLDQLYMVVIMFICLDLQPFVRLFGRLETKHILRTYPWKIPVRFFSLIALLCVAIQCW